MNKPLKVIHLVPGLGIGGTEKQVRLLLTRLDPARFACQLWALKSWGPMGDRLRGSRIPVKTFDGKNILSLPRLIYNVGRELRAERPDILHTWLTPANVVGRLAVQLSRIPVALISSLRVVEGEQESHIQLERLTHRFSQAVTVNAQAVREYAVHTLKIPENKLHTIPNAWEEEHAGSQAALNIPPDWLTPETQLIGAAGRLETQKGFSVLLEAFQQVAGSFPNARLVIAGTGSLKTTLARRLQEAPLRNRAILLDALPDLNVLLWHLRLFVLPSLWEGFPNVLMEAMARDIPVVASSVGGVPELITSQETGLLVPPGDAGALAHSMEEVLSDPGAARHRARAAKTTLHQNYSTAQTLRLTESLYERLCGTAA